MVIIAGKTVNTEFQQLFIESKVSYIPFKKIEIPSHIMLKFVNNEKIKKNFRKCALSFAKFRNNKRNEGKDIGFANIYLTKENLDQGYLCVIDVGDFSYNYNEILSNDIDILYKTLIKEGYC